MGIYPDPFWKLNWLEFDYFALAYGNKKREAWYHTRELLASICNQTLAITSQNAGKRFFKALKGEDIIPLKGDRDRPWDINPGSTEALNQFKEACKKLGIKLKVGK